MPGDVVTTIITYFLSPEKPANGTTSEQNSSSNATAIHPIIAGPSASVGVPQYVAVNTAVPSVTSTSGSKASTPTLSSSSSPPGSKGPSGKCGSGQPVIMVKNDSKDPVCYMVELNPETKSQDLDVACGPGNGIRILANQESEFCPGDNFVGALTAFHDNGKERGSRFEMNFADAGKTFFDVDYELGMDASTLGPFGDKKVQGHRDLAGKVDEAYQQSEKKAELQATGLLNVDGSGKVVEAKMAPGAPSSYVHFLQVEAGLQGYVVPGSVTGDQNQQGAAAGLDAMGMADDFSWSTEKRTLMITTY
ncbi:uncharacterized protein KY384_007640 [Bacidia gigantensis]|uniref:uncharacterized protein n=1 Tax=Bacidia gigantensis TaxID=2732470 RepID=UPI001D03BEE5|nr:uncharacterized protein KY384_007640 [Bacidia gigantensis]KAG8527488.1 hypothetical protein KY384_007640 [Bacidia gigantensis]